VTYASGSQMAIVQSSKKQVQRLKENIILKTFGGDAKPGMNSFSVSLSYYFACGAEI